MDAFEALGIEKTAGIADDEHAVHGVAWHGVPAAVRKGFCAIADEFAAVENFFQERVSLPGLKRGVRIEFRVGVFESDDQADGDAIVGKAVDPAAAVDVGSHGPAESVGDVARLDFSRLDIPQLLNADAVALRIDV